MVTEHVTFKYITLHLLLLYIYCVCVLIYWTFTVSYVSKINRSRNILIPILVHKCDYNPTCIYIYLYL